MRGWLWEAGTWWIYLSCAYPHWRLITWPLGRALVQWSGIRWEDVCDSAGDEVADSLNDQLGRRAMRQ